MYFNKLLCDSAGCERMRIFTGKNAEGLNQLKLDWNFQLFLIF